MRRHLVVALLALALAAMLAVPVASADPASSPQVQYRTFSCSDGNTYTGGFVSPFSGSFFLTGTTSTFAIKAFTIYYPSGPVTYNYGYPGFDLNSLTMCSYTDPQGIYNVFWGFFTPNA